MLDHFQRLLDRLVPARLRARGPDEVRRARLILGASLTVAFWGPLYTLVYALVGPPEAVPLIVAVTVGIAATPLFLHGSLSVTAAGNWFTAFLFLGVVSTSLLTGGHGAPALLWVIGLPMVALALVGLRPTLWWLGLTLALQAGLYVLDLKGVHVAGPPPTGDTLITLDAASGIGLTLMLLSVTWIYGKQANISLDEANRRLRAEVRQHRQTRTRLKRAEQLEALGRVVAGVGHEINNPLGYLLTNLDLLEEELDRSLDPDVREHIDGLLSDAQLGARRVRDVMRNVGVFSRGNRELGPVDVGQVLSDSVRLVSAEARHRAHILQDVYPVPPVRAHDAELGRILVNLLLNASDALPVGRSDEHEIRVTVRPEGDEAVRLEVSDTGTGIPEENLDRIFEPFFTTKDPGRGTGLGLAICHELVTRFGGTITVDSTEGLGTTFSIVLPADTEAASASDEDPAPATPAPQAPPRPSRRMRLLVIDDDRAMLRSMGRMLRDHDVTLVDQGYEAMRVCESGDFDVILCDLMMPDATGMEIYEAVRTIRPDLADRFLFVTGGAVGTEAQWFVSEMADRVLQKPFSREEVLRHANEMAGIRSGVFANGEPRQATG